MSLKLSSLFSVPAYIHTAQAFIYMSHAYRVYNNTKSHSIKRLSKTKDSQSGSQSISAHTSSFRGNFRAEMRTNKTAVLFFSISSRGDEKSCFSRQIKDLSPRSWKYFPQNRTKLDGFFLHFSL